MGFAAASFGFGVLASPTVAIYFEISFFASTSNSSKHSGVILK